MQKKSMKIVKTCIIFSAYCMSWWRNPWVMVKRRQSPRGGNSNLHKFCAGIISLCAENVKYHYQILSGGKFLTELKNASCAKTKTIFK